MASRLGPGIRQAVETALRESPEVEQPAARIHVGSKLELPVAPSSGPHLLTPHRNDLICALEGPAGLQLTGEPALFAVCGARRASIRSAGAA
jgi:hypothetical protein